MHAHCECTSLRYSFGFFPPNFSWFWRFPIRFGQKASWDTVYLLQFVGFWVHSVDGKFANNSRNRLKKPCFWTWHKVRIIESDSLSILDRSGTGLADLQAWKRPEFDRASLVFSGITWPPVTPVRLTWLPWAGRPETLDGPQTIVTLLKKNLIITALCSQRTNVVQPDHGWIFNAPIWPFLPFFGGRILLKNSWNLTRPSCFSRFVYMLNAKNFS